MHISAQPNTKLACSMIDYNHGKMGIRNLFHIKGSVLQKTLVWSLPASLLAAVLHKFVFEHNPDDGTKNVSNVVSSINGSFTYVLGFLVVFRTQQAYSRYWEGVSLIQQTRGQWFNATASLVAFCTENQEKKAKGLTVSALISSSGQHLALHSTSADRGD